MLFRGGDSNALAHSIDTVIGDRAVRDRLIANGMRRVEDFSMAGVAHRWACLLEDVTR